MANLDMDEGRDERMAALNRFAATGNDDGAGREMMIPAQVFSDDGGRVVGAQPVAVHRDDGKVLQKLAVLGAAAGDAWMWRWPVKSKDKETGKYVTEWIEGPTIKLANDLARIYGNCDVDVRVRDLGDSWLFYARFTDFETGFSMTRPFQQRKGQMDDVMKSNRDRARDMAFQIGTSKAIRNVIVNSLQTFADYAFEAAHDSIVEKVGKKLEKYRAGVVDALGREKIDVKRIERVAGRAVADWLAPDIARIIATMKAISDGMATWDESYPPLTETLGEQRETAATVEKTMDTFAGGAQPNAGDATAAASQPATAGEGAGADLPPQPGASAPSQDQSPSQSAAPTPGGTATASGQAATASSGAAVAVGEAQGSPTAKPGEPAKATVEERSETAQADAPASAAAPPKLTKENAKTIAGYSKMLMLAESANKLQAKGGEFFEGDLPDEGTPLGAVIAQVFDLHMQRVKGKLGAVEVEKAVKVLIGGAS